MPDKKDSRGGARQGAGRPNQDKERISVTVAKEVADRLKEEPNKSAAVEWALRDYFSITGPNSNVK